MIGKKFLAQINLVDTVEGTITSYHENSGRVTLRDEEGEDWVGYEYQLIAIDTYEK